MLSGYGDFVFEGKKAEPKKEEKKEEEKPVKTERVSPKQYVTLILCLYLHIYTFAMLIVRLQ